MHFLINVSRKERVSHNLLSCIYQCVSHSEALDKEIRVINGWLAAIILSEILKSVIAHLAAKGIEFCAAKCMISILLYITGVWRNLNDVASF